MLYLSLTGHDPIPEGGEENRTDKPGLPLPHSCSPRRRGSCAPAGWGAGPSHFVIASRGIPLRLCAAPALPPAREADDHARSMVSVA